jgi:hypothetical protein
MEVHTEDQGMVRVVERSRHDLEVLFRHPPLSKEAAESLISGHEDDHSELQIENED